MVRQSSYNLYSDEQLFFLLKEDDKMAYAEIFDRYWDKLFAVASNKIEDCFRAEDIVQELFIDIWRNRNKIEIRKTPNIYLAAMLKYKVIKARLQIIEEKKRHSTIGETTFTDSHFSSAQDMMVFSELRSKLENLVNSLPDKCQLVYRMNREDGFSPKQISKKLNLSERTVESHLYRALKILKEGLTTMFLFVFYSCDNINECKFKKYINIAVFFRKTGTI